MHKNPSKERVFQSRVYVKLDYIFRVYECKNTTEEGVCQARVYVNLV